MSKTKKNLGIIFLGLVAILGTSSFMGSDDTTLKEVGSDEEGVSCFCGQVNGRGCKADNRGARCNPNSNSTCWDYDRNCN